MKNRSGHCLCGSVRFTFDSPPNWQAHCHCESCRRNCSAPFTSYFGIDHGQWRWTGETPAVYVSSHGVKRHFCATCGTQMAYEGQRWPHEIHFYAASLENPAEFEPTLHVNWNEHLPWVHLCDGLPLRRTPRRLLAVDDLGPVLALIRTCFAYMDGIVDPPSSVHRLSAISLAQQADSGEIWVLEDQDHPIACVFLTPRDGHLYIGKLAVADAFRRQGLARQLLAHAEDRARDLGLATLLLESRVELTTNHAVFVAMGYARTGATAHPGYDRPTSFTFSKTLSHRGSAKR